nr:hypothetical protein [uncultured Mucilaginibacter sp.]
METVSKWICLLAIVFFAGCKKDSPNTPPTKEEIQVTKSMLVSPANNEPCVSGTNINTMESTVSFSWQKGENADTSTLVLKNLFTNGTITRKTQSNTVSVALLLGTPYSWYIISSSGKTNKTAQSDVWKLYNSGPGVINYAPFPAELVQPKASDVIASYLGKARLEWNATDVDGSNLIYDVYFGTNLDALPIAAASVTVIFLDVNIVKDKIYYWKVIARDPGGNASTSQIFSFRTTPY